MIPLLKEIHIPLSKNQTISTNIYAGSSINGLPIYENFRTGGPYDLPGLERDELWSEDIILLGLKYRFKLFKIWYFQANFSMGHGNDLNTSFLNSTKGLSTGLSADLPIGPLSILYGWNDDNREQLYFSMGYNF